MAYKAILLDLGGVIIPIDYGKPLVEFQKLGLNVSHDLFKNGGPDGILYAFERGEVSTKAFFEKLTQNAISPVSEKDFIKAWNSILLSIPPHRIEFLKTLGQMKPLFLLSNINDAHLHGFRSIVQQDFPGLDFDSLFIKTYYSHLLGLRKPDPKAFQCILEKHALTPHEVLYVDDSLEHIESALSLGIHARRIHPFDQDISTFIPKWMHENV
jgi:FMN phosphatase YigB (HAD superfamily)